MREVDEITERCYDCQYYHHTPARMYLANGDPGYPEENDCDKNWSCPFIAKHDDDDGFSCCSGCDETDDDECEKCFLQMCAEDI